jgi:transcriptional regulator with XRE-family HTH domain
LFPYTQATLIYLTGIPIWDYNSFLMNRSMWRAVRDMASINSTTIADRLGISPASISRYERGTRNPPKALMQDLHAAYVELYEKALKAAELMLAIDSYVDTFEPAKDIRVHDQPFSLDGFDAWIDQGVPFEDYTIDHVTPLSGSVMAPISDVAHTNRTQLLVTRLRPPASSRTSLTRWMEIAVQRHG